MPHEPKKRRSKAAKRTRRAAISLKALNLVVCKNCQSPTMTHMACRNCGFYGGKNVKGAQSQAKVTRA